MRAEGSPSADLATRPGPYSATAPGGLGGARRSTRSFDTRPGNRAAYGPFDRGRLTRARETLGRRPMSIVHAGRSVALAVAVGALLAATAIPALSARVANTATAKGSVTPGSGGPGTTFTLTYTTPIATGIKGKVVV